MTRDYKEALYDFTETMRRNPHYGGSGGLKLGTIKSIEEALKIADRLQSGEVSAMMGLVGTDEYVLNPKPLIKQLA